MRATRGYISVLLAGMSVVLLLSLVPLEIFTSILGSGYSILVRATRDGRRGTRDALNPAELTNVRAGDFSAYVTGSARAQVGTAGKEHKCVVKNVIVYYEPGRFCGWPANYGTWSWDNEILVGFRFSYYQEKERGHSYNRDMPTELVMARSLDGGESWKLERPPGVHPKKKSTECPGGIDFTNPDFALRCRSGAFTVSNDRGRSWSDPYKLPEFGQKNIMARTDYIVNSKNDCLIFLTASKTNGKEGRPFCARTSDGGKTIEFVSWISPEPEGFSIMPQSLRVGDKQLISAIRRKEEGVGFIEVYASKDDGKSWQFLSKPASTGRSNGNPADMVRLKDGRIVLTYGYRSEPCGIRAVISGDNGKTWGKEIHLRDDGRTWDLGYPQTVVRPDGKLVTVYYYTTEKDKEQHIAATIWDPDKVE